MIKGNNYIQSLVAFPSPSNPAMQFLHKMEAVWCKQTKIWDTPPTNRYLRQASYQSGQILYSKVVFVVLGQGAQPLQYFPRNALK